MTPKEKAKELVNKFMYDRPEHVMYIAKKCALTAVDELISYSWFSSADLVEEPYIYFQREYWQEVKKEIESL